MYILFVYTVTEDRNMAVCPLQLVWRKCQCLLQNTQTRQSNSYIRCARRWTA